MDIEVVPTKDEPITDIRKRMILNDIKETSTDYTKVLSMIMKEDRELFYDIKNIFNGVLETAIEKAFIEGQRTGTVHTEYIKGDKNEYQPKHSEVYRKRSDNYVGD